MTKEQTDKKEIAEISAIVEVGEIDPAAIFAEDGSRSLVAKISEHTKSLVFDVATEKGRDECRSIAYKIARSKTALDEIGKSLVADWKSRIKIVDAERKYIRDTLDALKEEVRAPLTEWEQRDEKRKEAHVALIREVLNFGHLAERDWMFFDLDETKKQLSYVQTIRESTEWEEFTERGTEACDEAIRQICEAIGRREKYDAEQAELAALRAQAAKEQQEADPAHSEPPEREAPIQPQQSVAIPPARQEQPAGGEAVDPDRERRKAINRRAVDALRREIGIGENVAIAVLTAIVKGKIPNVKMEY